MIENLTNMEAMLTDMTKMLKTVLQEQKQQEVISLMTKDDTEDFSVDMETIDDVNLNLNNDTESIGTKSNLIND